MERLFVTRWCTSPPPPPNLWQLLLPSPDPQLLLPHSCCSRWLLLPMLLLPKTYAATPSRCLSLRSRFFSSHGCSSSCSCSSLCCFPAIISLNSCCPSRFLSLPIHLAVSLTRQLPALLVYASHKAAATLQQHVFPQLLTPPSPPHPPPALQLCSTP